jgi:probable rRNA maturation factor
MLNIIRTDESDIEFNSGAIQKQIQMAIDKLNITDSEITLAFVSNKKIRELKKTYFGIDEITDVLSFKENGINPETGKIYLGDIVISPEVAKNQAELHEHSLESELIYLAVHGLLHLLEYDHSQIGEKRRMDKKQKEIIDFIGN